MKRMTEKGEVPGSDYLKMFDSIIEQDQKKFDDPASRKNNMEYDLLTTDWILEKARGSESYSQNLYAALCNNDFQKLELIPILKNQTWGSSWRYAGGIIADMRQQGDYTDWYCSGIIGGDEPAVYNRPFTNKYVPEGCVTDEIRNDLQRLGWVLVPGGDWEEFEKEVKKPK